MTRTSRPGSRTRPVVRLTAPGEIVGAVPHLCGFQPAESLVAVSLRGERSRVGLTLRFDLPAPAQEQALADEAAERLRADGARRAVAVLYTAEPDAGGELVRQALVDGLRDSCRSRGVEVLDVLLVRAERWVSYLCSEPACCPADGTPLADSAGSPTLGLVAAEQAADGRAVLASREELAASIAPPRLAARALAAQRLAGADADRCADRAARGRQAVIDGGVDRFREVLQRYREPPARVEPAEAAALAVALHDVLVRDEVATWALHSREPLLALLTDVARCTVAPHDAPVCTLLAWIAYAEGNGGLANVALERVLAGGADYSMATLLRQALDAQVPPEQIRAILRATGKELHRRRRRAA